MPTASEQPGAPELTSGGQTSLHSHAGGGGGADVKSGVEANILDNGTRAVTFNTPFAASPQVVITGTSWIAKDHYLEAVSITTNGFTISNTKAHSGGSDSIGVNWIATDAGNP